MKIVESVEQEIRRAIRDERAKDPVITINKLQERLKDRFQRDFHRDYLGKLTNKVARETLVEIDRAKIEERISFTRENYRMMREELMKIVYWKPDEQDFTGTEQYAEQFIRQIEILGERKKH
jgi:FKBP-type peptidyl-prolyl cis-trans isomerase (trigger factor)